MNHLNIYKKTNRKALNPLLSLERLDYVALTVEMPRNEKQLHIVQRFKEICSYSPLSNERSHKNPRTTKFLNELSNLYYIKYIPIYNFFALFNCKQV